MESGQQLGGVMVATEFGKTRNNFVIAEADRIRVQIRIFKLEQLVKEKQFSAERLWREFMLITTKELGSSSMVVIMLEILGFSDERILEFLAINNLSNSRICHILVEAKWSDARITAAFIWLNVAGINEYSATTLASIGVIDFLRTCGFSLARIIAALNENKCLCGPTLTYLLDTGLSEVEVFQAIVEGKCFQAETYQLLINFEDDSKIYWDDLKMINQMSLMNLRDGEIICHFKRALLRLSYIFGICEQAGWSISRTCKAYYEAGLTPGEIVNAYVDFSKDKMLDRVVMARKNKAKSDKVISHEDIDQIKLTAIKILEDLGITDENIFKELNNQEWLNWEIVDYLIIAKWSPRRIITAMRANDLTEFYLTKMVNDMSQKYESGSNRYMSYEKARLWKKLLKMIFTKREIEDLL